MKAKMKTVFQAWFCDGFVRYVLCLRCALSYCCSVTIILSLMFSISLITLGSIIIVVSQSYSTKNVSNIFKETQRMYLLHVSTLTREWMEQMPNEIETIDKWLKYQEKSQKFDLRLRSNTSLGVDSVVKCVIFLKGLALVSKKLSTFAYGSRFGNVCGYSNDNDLGLHVLNQTGMRPEVCCPYTQKDFISPGNRTDLPGHIQGWKMQGMDFLGGLEGYFPLGKFPFDHRLVPWYLEAMASGEDNDYAWASHYTVQIGNFATSVSKRFYDNAGEFAGVIIVQFTRSDGVKAFLESLNIDQGVLFIVDLEGGLIGTTNEAPTVIVDPITSIGHGVFASESEDDVIRETYDYLRARSHEIKEGQNVLDEIEIIINNDLYLVEAEELVITEKMKMTLIYVVKSDDVFESIKTGNITSIMICIGFIVFFSLFSSCMICIILCPLVSLSKQMKKVETMKLDKIKIWLSIFKEIRNVQKRFRFCVVKLKEYRAFLPDYLKNETKKIVAKRSIKDSSFNGSCSSGSQEEEKEKENSVLKRACSSRALSNQGSSSGAYSSEDEDNLSGTTLIVPKDKFGLGISRKMVVCLFIYLSNWKEVLESDFCSYCDTYFNFLDYITSLIRRFGSVLRFDVDRIILYYPRSSMKMAILHAQKIFNTTKTRRYTFKVIMGLSLDLSVVGVIGHNLMKTRCVFDGAIEKSKYMIDCFLSSERIQKKIKKNDDDDDSTHVNTLPCCVLLIESNSENDIARSHYVNSLNMLWIPLNIFAHFTTGSMKENGFFSVYRVFFESTVQMRRNSEWMYKLDRENKEKEKRFFLSAFHELFSGNLKKSKEYLMKITKRKKKREVIDDEEQIEYKNEILEIEEKTSSINNEEEVTFLDLSPEKLLEVLEEIEDSGMLVGDFEDYLNRNMEELAKNRCYLIDPSVIFSSKEKLDKIQL